jgi:pantoate kinase
MAGSVAYGTGSYAAGAAVIAAQMVVSQILKSPAATNALLAAERIAQKEGLDAAIDFLSKAKPIRRVIGQELARGEVGQDILKPTTDRIDNNIPAN